MRSPARLKMRDHLALEPGQVGIYREHEEHQDRDLEDRNNEEGVLGQEVVHDFASASPASGKDCIIVQNRPSVPLVKRLSFAERIKLVGTSYGGWPLRAN